MTLGLQGELKPGVPLASDHIIGSAKHFLADGGTANGKDQGDAQISEAELIRVHAQGYPPAIDAGILSVLVSFSSWNGEKFAANKSVLTDVLKGRMGFEGFVVDDWNAIGEIPGCTNTDCPEAMNAGLDMYMAPDSWKGLYANTLAEVKSGKIPMARLDDAVRRILRVKVKAGLFEGTRPIEGHFDRLGAPDHRALAREAVRKSLVLLKNNGGVLPIKASAHVLVAGDGADNIPKQCGGWTITWQGTGNKNKDFPHGQSIFSAVSEAVKAGGGQAELAVDGRYKQKPDVAIVVFGEDPYAEFQGDVSTVAYRPGDTRDLALLKSLKAQGVPVVAVFLSGRPLFVNPEINASDAFVAAWLPGTEAGGIADVLVRKPDGSVGADFSGKLSFPWPRRADQAPLDVGAPGYDPQFPYGFGLTYASAVTTPQLSEDPGVTTVGPNVANWFVAGHVPAPFLLETSGEVSLKSVDAGAQENGRSASWSGPGSFRIWGPQIDLSRQATGDMVILMRYRMDAAPAAPVILSMACGTGCGADADLTPYLAKAPLHEWTTLKVRLACLRTKGVQMDKVTTPFQLRTTAPFTFAFTDLRLDYNQGDAVCPN
jgi:beta-glucosidase